ncbi:MAG: hypothetical protein IPL53_14760 [Ignavibacteria bacterium]|nr:hypothetical protein [Ignavibacteria bacterium]
MICFELSFNVPVESLYSVGGLSGVCISPDESPHQFSSAIEIFKAEFSGDGKMIKGFVNRSNTR